MLKSPPLTFFLLIYVVLLSMSLLRTPFSTKMTISSRIRIIFKTVYSLDVARRDHMEFFVESILDHRTVQTHSSAQFLVKWLDYPDSANSWEPYSNLREIEVFHDYLKLKKLHRLLNKQHR